MLDRSSLAEVIVVIASVSSIFPKIEVGSRQDVTAQRWLAHVDDHPRGLEIQVNIHSND
jgi:hypothetical protein